MLPQGIQLYNYDIYNHVIFLFIKKLTSVVAHKNLQVALPGKICHFFSKMKKKWQHEITIEVPAWFFYVDYFHFYLYHLLKIEVKKKTFGGACFNICDV